MDKIAIIPARSGSKGLVNKNIKLINGKPLMAYTIEAAIKSGIFTRVHVSTDSQEYADIAKEYGADVPFLRSDSTSTDTASSWDVVREVLDKYEKIGLFFSECMLLQPTSPLRDEEDIKCAYELFNSRKADSLVSVCRMEHPIQWCFTLDESLSMDAFDKSPYKNMRRQELENHYRENGAIYLLKTEKFMSKCFNFYGSNCIAYIMDSKKSIDIDFDTDFEIAEVLLSKNDKRKRGYK